MSSSKGTSNSNKTAHVMNLLRKNTPQAPSDPVATEQPVASSAPVPTPQTPPIITALHADAEVSSQIRDALTDALAQEEGLSSPQQVPHSTKPAAEYVEDVTTTPPASELEDDPQPAPVQAPPPPAEEPAASPSSEPALIHAPEASSQAEETAEQPSVTTTADTSEKDNASTEDAVLINVMERLAMEKADKYIRLFGLCTCERCRKDVIALSLNVLPAKYVVMPEWEFSICSDMFAKRYSSDLTSQLLHACKTVMDNPRHQL